VTSFQFGLGERWALVSAVGYTAVGVMLRVAAPTIDPVLGSLLRLIPVTLIAAAILVRTGAREVRPPRPEYIGGRLILALFAAGIGSFVVGNILFFLALGTGGLGVTAGGVQAGSVLGGLWIGLLALGERPRRGQLVGAALIVGGLAGIAVAQTATLADLWWIGLLLAFGAGTTYAAANAVNRFAQRNRPLLWATLALSGIGGLVPLAAIVGWRAAIGELGPIDPVSAGQVLLAGVVNSVALASLASAVRHAPVATVNSISSSSVVFSFVASVVIFDETGSGPMILGIVLVTAGIVASQFRRGATPPPKGTTTGMAAAAGGAP
jgi:drug/metabolite transporter (DMT)-like permease